MNKLNYALERTSPFKPILGAVSKVQPLCENINNRKIIAKILNSDKHNIDWIILCLNLYLNKSNLIECLPYILSTTIDIVNEYKNKTKFYITPYKKHFINIVSLCLAVKYLIDPDIFVLNFTSLYYLTHNKFDINEYKNIEIEILNKIDFTIKTPCLDKLSIMKIENYSKFVVDNVININYINYAIKTREY